MSVAWWIAAAALVAAVAALGAFVRRRMRLRAAIAAMADDVRLIAAANPEHRVAPGGPDLARLAAAINALADRSEGGAGEAGAMAGSGAAEREASQLAVLLAHLRQGVMVCGPRGDILLYNSRARQLIEPDSAGEDAGLVALGRSVFAFLDANLIRHGLDEVCLRAAQGQQDAIASLMTAAPTGQLLRLRLVRASPQAQSGGGLVGSADQDGFALLLEDVTREVEAAERADALMHSLTERAGAMLASLGAALEALRAFPDMEAQSRNRFTAILAEECAGLASLIEGTRREYAEARVAGWPLEPIAAGDLVAAAVRRIALKLAIGVTAEPVDAGLWLRADGFSLLQAICCLASRLRYELGVPEVRIGAAGDARFVRFEVRWPGRPLALETWHSWEAQPLRMGGEASPLSLGDVVRRHGGEAWQRYDPQAECGVIEILLPTGAPHSTIDASLESAPANAVVFAGDSPPESPSLGRITVTAIHIDAEGTDAPRIVALGGARIVDGMAIVKETFGQLTADAAALDAVLPAFQRFCGDGPLVAWDANRARTLLRAHEVRTGTSFRQTFVDARALFAAIRTGGAASADEAAAALGCPAHDASPRERARTIARIFLKMLPLLQERGITRLDDFDAGVGKTLTK